METHSGLSILPCRICEFETTRKATLDHHFKSKHCQNKTVSIDEYHHCTKCDKKFLGKFALTNHKCCNYRQGNLPEELVGEDDTYQNCLACAYVASSPEELEMHIVDAHAFPCEI